MAIKQLSKVTLPQRGVRRVDVEREIQMMGAMRHQNIVRLHETFEDKEAIYMALEYCDGGDFGDKVLERGESIREPEVAYWVGQMMSAIAFLHSHFICHRDIKPDNFLVQGSSNHLKLADLGLACECPSGMLLSDKCGTPAFMSPEQHGLPRRSKGYGLAVDVWAAGITMYMVMFGGKHPFLNARGALNEKSMLAGELDFRKGTGLLSSLGLGSNHMSEEARRLCQMMVTVEPHRRITAGETLSRPWFNEARGMEPPNGRLPIAPAAGTTHEAPREKPVSPARSASPRPARGTAVSTGFRESMKQRAGSLKASVKRKLAKLPMGRRPSSNSDVEGPETNAVILPPGARATGPPGGGPLWEFAVGDGFRAYQAECHEVLEEQYQAFRAGKAAALGKVVSMGREVEVDFQAMLQRVRGSTGRTRRVRRRG